MCSQPAHVGQEIPAWSSRLTGYLHMQKASAGRGYVLVLHIFCISSS